MRNTIKSIVKKNLAQKAELWQVLEGAKIEAKSFLQLDVDYYNLAGQLQNLLDEDVPKESAENLKALQKILDEVMQTGIDNNLSVQDPDYVDSKYFMNELSEAMDGYREVLQCLVSIRPELDKIVAALAKVTGQY